MFWSRWTVSHSLPHSWTQPLCDAVLYAVLVRTRRSGRGVCFLYWCWTGLSESAQCWSSDNVPIVFGSSSTVRLRNFPPVLSLYLCLTCRWRSPKTKCTWTPTAWCSTCRTKRASGESSHTAALLYYMFEHAGHHQGGIRRLRIEAVALNKKFPLKLKRSEQEQKQM